MSTAAGPRGAAAFVEHLRARLDEIRAAGLFKAERLIDTPQDAHVKVLPPAEGPATAPAPDAPPREVLNLCANNYLGLAEHPEILAAAREGLERWGYGMASVRFICGTQTLHKTLERAIADFLAVDDAILYSSCFDANAGLFETLLGPEDAIVSDELNHASIIDGVRLCKARRYRYKNNDMADLRAKLEEARDARFRLVATDGVFSMDGYVAKLADVCELADRHDALVMVDDSHAVGFVGPDGRGTPALHGVADRVDVVTGTLGKALGGASGGYAAGRAEIVAMLRQRSRPYLFSNSLAPPIAAASLKALELVTRSPELRQRLAENTRRFRAAIADLGYAILPGDHPIVPVMIGDAALAARVADALLRKGLYVVGFSYPVVPHGKARIRTQMSAAHTPGDIDFAINAFAEVKSELNL